uniref:Uncharacterized protein n=1 Tax=Parascaris equorum TaxID=6256 RepID=A0A914R2A0_PAREQ
MPPPNPKQLRKWQKKHKKLLKKMASMPPPVLTHAPPPVPPYTRAFSVDNLNRCVFVQNSLELASRIHCIHLVYRGLLPRKQSVMS